MTARLLACALVILLPCAAAAQPSAQLVEPDGLTQLILAIQKAADDGDGEALRARVAADVRPALVSEFVQGLTFPKATHAAVKERDRAATSDGGVRVLIETFTDRSGEGRVASWRLDTLPAKPGAPWTIVGIERLTVVNGLFRLALDTATEYDVQDLVVRAPDLTLTLPRGVAFLSKTPDGPTGVVLLGRGRAEFAPKQEAERGQLKIFSGSEVMSTEFSAVFLRLHPAEFDSRLAASSLKARPADPARARRATEVFDTYVSRSFQIDLNDLSRENWSLVPSLSDVVAEIVTSRFGALTYARSGAEPEDVSFFDRRRHRNIAVYASDDKLAARGRFFSEDERVEYDVTKYDIEASFAPDRSWVEGTARLSLRTRSPYFSTLTVRLAEPLVVRSVTSPIYGRLLHLRVVGQNSVLIGFPSTIVSQTDIDVVINYGGRLPPQSVDREAIALEQDQVREDPVQIPIEPQYTYSNRSYWYPQAPVTDYATAKMVINVPGDLDVVASGVPVGSPSLLPAAPGQRPRKRVTFETTKPTRYLAVLISRFQSTPPAALTLTDDGEVVSLVVAANPRQASKARALGAKASDILKFYASLVDDAPYESFTLALTESDVPGGHSPAYFALLNQPVPLSPFVWTNDPVSFPNYPSFFIAHELAHQWWGQAVGWKNYHEQWISEGFAQYFAALYADRERPEQFGTVLRQMRKWAMELSPQGPVYLGYRLGHIRGEGRTFRALVYNKGAMVLHMLRRLVGDERFYAGLREFYTTWRYRKAGTDDFRLAMEQASGRSLERFFDRWVFGSRLPEVHFSSRVTGSELVVRFEQKGDLFDVPIAVTITYDDGRSEDVVVVVAEREVQQTIQLKGSVRSVEANRDAGALVDVKRF